MIFYCFLDTGALRVKVAWLEQTAAAYLYATAVICFDLPLPIP